MLRPCRWLAALILVLVQPVDGNAQQTPEAAATVILNELWHSTGTPGISVAVAYGGRMAYSHGIGFADLDNMVPATGSTAYNVGSVSKVIAAVAVMQLVEQKKVGLDDIIRDYVPTFPHKEWAVTVRHILTHTSGIRHYRSGDFTGDSAGEQRWRSYASLKEAISIFKDDPLLFEPGRYYSYSSYAVNLLQGVVETASGKGFEEYLRDHVWEPAGMHSTTFDFPERIVPRRAKGYLVRNGSTVNHPWENMTYKFAAGGMISTAEDLVRFGAALNAGRLIRPQTLAIMFEAQLGDTLRFGGDDSPDELGFEQALMWRIRKDAAGRDYINHCGTVKGFNACLIIYDRHDLIVSILGNGHPVTPAIRGALAMAQFFLESGPDASRR